MELVTGWKLPVFTETERLIEDAIKLLWNIMRSKTEVEAKTVSIENPNKVGYRLCIQKPKGL